MDKFFYALQKRHSKQAKLGIITRGTKQIHELKSKKTWLEAYRNSYLHFIGAVTVYADTHKHTTVRMRTRIPHDISYYKKISYNLRLGYESYSKFLYTNFLVRW